MRALVFALIILFWLPVHGQQKTVVYSGEDFLKIGFEEISYGVANDSLSNLDRAKRFFNAGKFTPNQLPDLNLGIAKENYWVAFTIQNKADKESSAFVLLGNPRLNDVDVFIVSQDSLQQKFKLGDNFPFGVRPLDLNEFAFPLKIQAGESIKIFLLISHKGNTLQMPITIRSMNSLMVKAETTYLQTGFITGILVIAFFFGLFFLINTRDVLFVYYSGYMITAALWVWTTEGYAFQFLWPNTPELATRLGPAISAISACFFVANCLQFSKPYDNKSLFRKILIGFLIFLTLWASAALMPFVPITEKTMSVYLSVFFTCNITFALLLVVYLIRLFLKGHTIVLYFFLAVLTTILSAVLVVLKGSGVITISFSSSTVMSGGYIVELILMTAGITKQFYNYRKEKELALIAYGEQQKSIAQKILETQEGERRRIGRELHDDIGAGLTQISLMSEVAKNYSSSSKSNLKELEDIAHTSRGLVQSMSEIIWALHPDNKTLNQLLVYTREQLNKLLEYSGKDFAIQFPQLEAEIPLSNVHLRNILLIIKESVNNAVKYSEAPQLNISCEIRQNSVLFEVRDNGKGMDIEKIKVGNGLKNMQKRASEINGTFELISATGTGTSCRLLVPIT